MELNVRIAALVSIALWLLTVSSTTAAQMDSRGGVGFVDMECWEEEVTPAPSVTDTVVPTLPPVITVVPTPEATETPRSSRIYVPLVDNGCEPWRERASVVLVLDMSTSMYRETRAGRSKHEAALEAAHRFTDLMQPGDGIGVVGFNDLAWTAAPVGYDRWTTHQAIDGLLASIQEGTRLDLALEMAQAVVAARPLQEQRPVIILLTDGLPNRVPFGPGSTHPGCDRQECTVLEYANAAKSAGTRIYTVGLGEPSDVLADLLRDAASDRTRYYYAPDGEDLARIYAEIAGREVGCYGGSGLSASDNPVGSHVTNEPSGREIPDRGSPDPRLITDGIFTVDGEDIRIEDIPRDELVILEGKASAPPGDADTLTTARELGGIEVPELGIPAVGWRVVWTRGRDGAIPRLAGARSPSVSMVRRPQVIDIPDAEQADPIGDIRPQLVPDDTYYQQQYHLHSVTGVNVPGAWDISTGSGVKIAILDTGIECRHPDLACYQGTHYDARARREVSVDEATDPPIGHGTLVGGTAAAIFNNARGVAGVAPAAELIMVRVCSSGGTCSELDITAGAEWARHRADVLNLSLGGSFTVRTQAMCDTLGRARDENGAVVVAAVGNGGSMTPLYPASCTGVIGVGATDRDGGLATFSERAAVDVIAPGVDIVGTCVGSRYGQASGTSFSSPIVAGFAALIRARRPDWTPVEVESLIFENARRTGRWAFCGPGYNQRLCGWGMVDVETSLRAMGPGTPSAPTLTATPPIPVTPAPGETSTPPGCADPVACGVATAKAQTATAAAAQPTPTATPSGTRAAQATPTLVATGQPTCDAADPIACAQATLSARVRGTATANAVATLVAGTLRAPTPTRTLTSEEALRSLYQYFPLLYRAPELPTRTPAPDWARTATAFAIGTETPHP